jgi:hypothetical protein
MLLNAVLRGIIGVAIACSLSACSRPKEWTDEVLLHDGRTIEVKRSVYFHFGGGDLSTALTKYPDQYSLKAKNPDTGKVVHWSGERKFAPILLDFTNQVPYLVMVATHNNSDLGKYGCPEIPYVFLRYDEQRNDWHQLRPEEFPPTLLRANLLFDYYPNATRLSKEEIDKYNRSSEFSSGGFMSRAIPKDFASWSSRYKNQFRVGHELDGCRHTVPSNEDPSHPQGPGHDAQLVDLEILETQMYEPERVFLGEEWKDVSWDQLRADQCMSLVRRVGDASDRPELRGWLLFVNDSTGNKKARNLGQMFCNSEALWFTEYWDPQHVILTKFTVSGDFVYRVKFARPAPPSGYSGFIVQSTFRADDGYLNFEWWNAEQSGSGRRARRSMKVRIRESQLK